MAYASVTYTSASGTTFALTNSNGDPIPYLRQADISVTVNGTGTAVTSVGGSLPAKGASDYYHFNISAGSYSWARPESHRIVRDILCRV